MVILIRHQKDYKSFLVVLQSFLLRYNSNNSPWVSLSTVNTDDYHLPIYLYVYNTTSGQSSFAVLQSSTTDASLYDHDYKEYKEC